MSSEDYLRYSTNRLGLIAMLFCSVLAPAQPAAKPIGKDLYAYVSDNDSSANSTFLVGATEILVVDTGLNSAEGAKLLTAIRQISSLPVRYVVNTHYHPDHQGGNTTMGPDAIVISTDYTRKRTMALMKAPGMEHFRFRPAELTFQKRVTVRVGDYPVEIYFPGKAHTSGDAVVYFPEQQAIAMGDLFLNRSSPAMDDGSAENWIQALNHVLELPVKSFVPGHFEIGTKSDLRRFRDYLNDLYEQVKALKERGETLEQVRHNIRMEKYSDFRQYPKFEATFSDNAATIYGQLESH
ncbi:MAG: MBL fold metallo-hydrolase [Candidatus Sulfotelmatobacter sp.]